MTTVIYDGSFEGLLTAVFEVYEYRLHAAEIVSRSNFQSGNMFAENHDVQTDFTKADRVMKKLEAAVGKEGIRRLLYVYFSEDSRRERLIYSAIRQSLDAYPDKNVLQNFADEDILAISKICKSMSREIHRLHAFVRFEKLSDGSFFAKVHPDFNVLPLGYKFFEDRYRDQKWLIYDVKRNFGVVFDLCETTFFYPEEAQPQQFASTENLHHDEEKAYQQLWQRYFAKTNIAERRNLKLHTQHVPKRYWKYLTEKGG